MSEAGPEPRWLAVGPDPVLAFLHCPPASRRRATAVLICPPFGWEEMCSYRARRRWAQALSDAGFPAARLDLPATGDSGGTPRDPDRVAVWVAAVAGTAGWLRERAGADRLAAIGIGLGGLIACRAVADGAPIDDLILWGVPATGRLLLREARAFASVVAARHPADAGRGPALPEGASELIGFLLDGPTALALDRLDLTELDIPEPRGRHVLLLGRDGLSPDRRLRVHLERAGATVTVQQTLDHGALMAHPQEAHTPHKTIERTITWLTGQADGPARRPPPPASAVERDAGELQTHERPIRERTMAFALAGGATLGVVSEPLEGDRSDVCVVLLNGGALRHTGPNRTWVEAARRWAARGVPSVRVDLLGIGDGDGDERTLVSNDALYAPQSNADTLAIVDQLADRGLGRRFVLGGLCSGAYWSLHAALADPRVCGALMINLYSFYWSPELVDERAADVSLSRLSGRGWRRLVRGDITRAQFKETVRGIRPSMVRSGGRRPVERSQRQQIERDLDVLHARGTEVLLLLSDGEPLHDQLQRQGLLDQQARWPNLTIERIPSRDHMFRALWLQQLVHASVDRAVQRVL